MFSGAKNPYDDIVAKATDENQTSEDWGVLSTVWDKVNDDGATGARNCVQAIQKRLQHRNANVQLYALTLSDSLVNNCGINLHREISSRAFTQTLTRLVSDRTTHDKVKKRTMQLLKNWSGTFKKDESLGIVEETYETLKKNHRMEDAAPAADPVPHSLLKQEEEDMQRAIRESEALAAQRNARPTGYVPAPASNHNAYGQASSSAAGGGGQFFTQADGKALPDIQAQQPPASYDTAAHMQPGSAPANKAPSRVKALYDFEPQEDGELAFRRGDVIRVVNSAYEGWWKGELDGRIGIFPLTYIEIIPDPTPESIARDAETEAQVFSQAGSVDRLLAMLSAADAQGSSISEDDELMELYQQCILLRPKIVKLLDKYSQKQKDLSSLHDKFKVAKTAYDQMLEESYQRMHPAHQEPQLQQYGSAYGVPAQQPQQMPYGAVVTPPVGGQGYPGHIGHQQQRHGSFGSQGGPPPQLQPGYVAHTAQGSYSGQAAYQGPPQQGYLPSSTPAPEQASYPQQQAMPGAFSQHPHRQGSGGAPAAGPLGSQPYAPQAPPSGGQRPYSPPQVQVQAPTGSSYQPDNRATSPPQQNQPYQPQGYAQSMHGHPQQQPHQYGQYQDQAARQSYDQGGQGYPQQQPNGYQA